MSIFIQANISIDESELTFEATRSQGAGGQNVNKVATAIYLRFNIFQSSLSDKLKRALIASNDSRINTDGVLVIRAQNHRTQEQNKRDAIERLKQIIRTAAYEKPIRKASRPSRSSVRKRLDSKAKSGIQKQLRKKVDY